jgi:anti-sigma factor (TIGR02949 family)
MSPSESCHHLLDSLSAYVDGELSEALCRELERHLADCEDCRVVIDTLKKTIELYRETITEPEVPADVRARLFHRLRLEDYLD